MNKKENLLRLLRIPKSHCGGVRSVAALLNFLSGWTMGEDTEPDSNRVVTRILNNALTEFVRTDISEFVGVTLLRQCGGDEEKAFGLLSAALLREINKLDDDV